jgi:tRNA-2-methylthio-N6-dimethylallyladenosine synthase
MNRGYTAAEYLEFLDRARTFLHQPEIGRPLTIAGDIIVGFPGETDADFAATESLLQRARYKNCYIFKYSPRPGTPAFNRLNDDVPDGVKRARNNRLLALQQDISDSVGREFVGSRLDVFVEGISPRERKRRRESPDSPREGGRPGVALTVGGKAVAPGPPPGSSDADDVANGDPPQLTARTEGDVIVHFTPRAGRTANSLVGSIVPVVIDACRGLALSGTMAE